MTINGVFFGGRRLVRSQAYATVDATRMAGMTPGAQKIPVILGDAQGGKPGTILKYTSPSQAQSELYDGDLLAGVKLAFAPSSDLRGAQEVWAVRLNPATVSTKNLPDVVPQDVLALTSKWYGKRSTEIEAKIVAGTTNGVHIYIRHLPSGAAEDQDNLQDALIITYSGNAATATHTITVTSGNAVTFATTLSGQSDGSVALSIDLTNTSYNTVAKLATFINGQQGYSAVYSPNLKNQNLASSYLDAASAVNIKVAATVTAKLGSIIDWINNNSGLVTAAKVGIMVTAPKPVGWTALAGGTEGTTATQNWTDALTLLEKEDISFIVPLTTTGANIAMVDAHVQVMRANMRLRKGVYGHPVGETIANIKALAGTLNNTAAVLATPGIQTYDKSGVLTTYSSCFTACALAGMNCGLDSVAIPLTGHLVSAIALEKTYSDQEVDGLIQNGVLPIRYDKGKNGFEVALACTTYMKDSNILYSEWSVSDIADYISGDMKTYLESLYKGKPATKTTVNTLRDDVESRLKTYERSQIITSGVDRLSGQPVNAYRNIQVRFSQGAVMVDYEVSPVEPMNWILITTHAVSIDITA